MNEPKRIQRKRTKGWKMPENTVSVTRPGRWGNPFKFEYGCSDSETVAKYKSWIDGNQQLCLQVGEPPKRTEIINNLRGKNLACFCKEGDPCHGDILLKIANS